MDINRGSFQVVASHQICDKYGAPVAYTFREDDATLYAAAPELLEAVRQVMGWIDGWNPNFIHDPEWPEVAHHVRAAIAKATGANQ